MLTGQTLTYTLTLTNTVGGYTEAQLDAVSAQASALVGSSFTAPLALADGAYTAALGSCELADYTAEQVLDLLIDQDSDTCRTDTDLSGLVVPDLYGGLDIKKGFITDVSRTRLIRESYLSVGDVTVGEYGDIYEVFLYLGQGQLAKVSSTDGICTLVTSTGDAYSGTNVFATFIAYDRYVILRPSLVG